MRSVYGIGLPAANSNTDKTIGAGYSDRCYVWKGERALTMNTMESEMIGEFRTVLATEGRSPEIPGRRTFMAGWLAIGNLKFVITWIWMSLRER